jgi:phospholipase/lecithinase/hemolysin
MDANAWTFLGLLVTTIATAATTITLAVLNYKKSGSIETKVDAGNATTESVHHTVNGNNAVLQRQLAEANAEVARLNRLLPPGE